MSLFGFTNLPNVGLIEAMSDFDMFTSATLKFNLLDEREKFPPITFCPLINWAFTIDDNRKTDTKHG